MSDFEPCSSQDFLPTPQEGFPKSNLTADRVRATHGNWMDAGTGALMIGFESVLALQQALETGRLKLKTKRRGSGSLRIKAGSLCDHLEEIAREAEGDLM